MAATKAEQAFKTIDGLEYSKEWDTSGSCIVLREAWSENGVVVRQVEHNFAADTVRPPESETTIIAQSESDVTVDLTGVDAQADAGKI